MASAHDLRDLGTRARAASRHLATASTGEKDAALRAAAELLAERTPEILEANREDLRTAEAAGMEPGPLDRLRLDDGRVAAMAAGVRQVAGLADPVGEILDGWRRPNGLEIQRVRVPLGVVAVIYENRPNVTSDAAALCLRSGNATILRGSASALHSNRAVTAAVREGIAKAGLPEDCVQLLDDVTHEGALGLMQLTEFVDCLVPRGGPGLIASITEHASVPVIIDGAGNCHVYVDADADVSRALDIVVNAKTQRTSVCNAAESLVVHQAVAAELLPRVAEALGDAGVDLVGDGAARALAPMGEATEEDFGREYLDARLSIAVVPTLDDAIEHVNRFGTGHSEAIVTTDLDAARRFAREVDAAAVVVNASTRFVDGEEFGFGAEIGISTQKLHARGPMGPRELTTYKYVVWGDGQVRH